MRQVQDRFNSIAN